MTKFSILASEFLNEYSKTKRFGSEVFMPLIMTFLWRNQLLLEQI